MEYGYCDFRCAPGPSRVAGLLAFTHQHTHTTRKGEPVPRILKPPLPMTSRMQRMCNIGSGQSPLLIILSRQLALYSC